MSKANGGKAHFVLEGDVTACARRSDPYGMLMSTLFKTKFIPLRVDDHLQCGRCRIRVRSLT